MVRDLHPDLGGQLLSVQDAAEWCDVHEKTIYRAIKTEKLEAHKVGARWRIRPEALDEFYEGEG